MDHIEDNYVISCNSDKAYNPRAQMGKSQHHSQNQVRDFFDKLMLWRDESQRHFSMTINTYSNSINEAMNNLVEEVRDLQAQLKERNDLIEKMKNMSGKKEHTRGKLPMMLRQHEPCYGDTLDLNGHEEGQLEAEETGIEKPVMASGIALDQQTWEDKNSDDDFSDVDSISIKDESYNEEVTENDTVQEDHYEKETFRSRDKVVSYGNENLVAGEVNRDGEDKSAQNKGHKKFKCDQCPYASYNKGHLKQHITAVHDKIKSHVCGDCGYASSCKGNLNRHREYVHNKGDTKFKCEQCPYLSVSKGGLKGHNSLVHGKKKNHVCARCGYAASNKKHLNQHMLSIHKSGNEKYDCDMCLLRYQGEEGLRNHVNSFHLKKGVA